MALDQVHFDQIDPATLAGIPDINSVRFDNSTTGFLPQALQYFAPQVLETKYPDTMFANGELVPSSPLTMPGVKEITYKREDVLGEFQPVGNNVSQVAPIDVNVSDLTYKTRYYAGYVSYSIMDNQRSETAQKLAGAYQGPIADLAQRKLNALQLAYMRKRDQLIALGDEEVPGFLNNPDIPTTYTAVPFSNASTPDAILTVLHTLANSVSQETQQTHFPNVLILAPAEFDYISTTRRASPADKTILQTFLDDQKAMGQITKVVKNVRLTGRGDVSANNNIAMVYELNPEVLESFTPMPLQILAPQQHGLEFRVYGVFQTGGTHVKYPRACRRLEIAAA